MGRAALVVHSFSYPFVKNVVHFIHEAIRANFDHAAEFMLCDTVGDAQYSENTSVFLIGENFPAFQRRPGCTYIYLNFSVVTVLGPPWETGITARRAIWSKRRMLNRRLPSIDILLDYYPPQTSVLQRQLKIPVFGFDVATRLQSAFIPMRDRKYDVCFVGNLNARRQAVCDAITQEKITLSPSNGIAIEDAAAQSRICLNVHSVKSNHFETPRFVAALSTGTPILTEPSFGSQSILDRSYVTESNPADMPFILKDLLSQRDRLEASGRDAQRWYTEAYVPRAQGGWAKTFAHIQATRDSLAA